MGRDKALLPFKSNPLLIHLAKVLVPISSDFHILAPPGRYESFGFAILNDKRNDSGPLAGIEVALETSTFDWNLILACDLPFIEANWLIQLASTALNSPKLDCIASATTPDSPNPLCAVCTNPRSPKSALPSIAANFESDPSSNR